MNDRSVHRAKTALKVKNSLSLSRLNLSAFPTPLGWIGLLGEEGVLTSIFIGRSSEKAIYTAASRESKSLEFCDWSPSLRNLFEAYADGEVVDFSDVEIQLPAMTTFRQRIVMATRNLSYGETTSYGELASQIGHPRAARAVGTVMSTNRFPVLIPCHRVLAAGGKLGGYTSPSGTNFKLKLLEMEACAIGLPPRPRIPR